MDLKKLVLVFYCATVCSAEKRVSVEGQKSRKSYATAVKRSVNPTDLAGSAEESLDDIIAREAAAAEMTEFLERQHRARMEASRETSFRHHKNRLNAAIEDQEDDDDFATEVKGNHSANTQMSSLDPKDDSVPVFFIAQSGNGYAIPESLRKRLRTATPLNPFTLNDLKMAVIAEYVADGEWRD